MDTTSKLDKGYFEILVNLLGTQSHFYTVVQYLYSDPQGNLYTAL